MAQTMAGLLPWQTRTRPVHYLSFLPLNHVVEGILATYAAYYLPAPVAVTYLEDFRGLQQALLRVRPTAFFSVPRVFEKAWEAIGGQPRRPCLPPGRRRPDPCRPATDRPSRLAPRTRSRALRADHRRFCAGRDEPAAGLPRPGDRAARRLRPDRGATRHPEPLRRESASGRSGRPCPRPRSASPTTARSWSVVPR